MSRWFGRDTPVHASSTGTWRGANGVFAGRGRLPWVALTVLIGVAWVALWWNAHGGFRVTAAEHNANICRAESVGGNPQLRNYGAWPLCTERLARQVRRNPVISPLSATECRGVANGNPVAGHFLAGRVGDAQCGDTLLSVSQSQGRFNDHGAVARRECQWCFGCIGAGVRHAGGHAARTTSGRAEDGHRGCRVCRHSFVVSAPTHRATGPAARRIPRATDGAVVVHAARQRRLSAASGVSQSGGDVAAKRGGALRAPTLVVKRKRDGRGYRGAHLERRHIWEHQQSAVALALPSLQPPVIRLRAVIVGRCAVLACKTSGSRSTRGTFG
eukprot:ctg_708.g353